MESLHEPVLLKEAVHALCLTETGKPKGGNYIDGTCGTGGHSELILQSGADKLLCIDWDLENLIKAQKRLQSMNKHVLFIHDNYKNILEITKENDFSSVRGILLDLGFSSPHLTSGRGFSFLKNEPLDMRYNRKSNKTAAQVVNTYSEKELARIFKEYGEERFAVKIAKRIVRQRKEKKFETTDDLVHSIRNCMPARFIHQKIHFATRVFQAIRIEVNDEFENIKNGIHDAIDILESNGRLAVITFHSLEDRIVKNIFREESTGCICPLDSPVCICNHQARIKKITKKPITPSVNEIKNNPRARSAKLRVVEKI